MKSVFNKLVEEGEKKSYMGRVMHSQLYIILDSALSEYGSSQYQSTSTSGVNINSYQCEELIAHIKKTQLTLLEVCYTQESIHLFSLLSHYMKKRVDSGL